MGKVWNLKVLYILITTTFVVVSAWPLESLHHNGMFAHKYSNICAQQQRGVNICCVPSIHISQFISAAIWPESPALWARGPGRDAAAPGTFIVESRDLGCEDKITKVLRKYSTAEDGDYQKNYTPDLLNTKLDLLCEHWWGNEKWPVLLSLKGWIVRLRANKYLEAIVTVTPCAENDVTSYLALSSLVPPLLYLTHTAAQHWQHSTLTPTMIPQILWIGSWFWNNGLNVVSQGWISGTQECKEGCGGPAESQE